MPCLDWEKATKSRCYLAKPETFMNRSGVAVAALLQQYGVTAADLVVIYDDLDLPLGRIRIRTKGSAGGHRGVSSIIEHLGGVPFNRIRIGIGRPPEGTVAIDYVLAPFGAAEMADLSDGHRTLRGCAWLSDS